MKNNSGRRGEERRGEVLKVPLLSHCKTQTKSVFHLPQDDNDDNNNKINTNNTKHFRYVYPTPHLPPQGTKPPQQPLYFWKPAKCPSFYSRHVPPGLQQSFQNRHRLHTVHRLHLVSVCGQTFSLHSILGQQTNHKKKNKNEQDPQTRLLTNETKCTDIKQINLPKSQPVNKKCILPPAQDQGALCICLAIAPCTIPQWRSAVHFSMGSLYRDHQLPFGEMSEKLSPPRPLHPCKPRQI